MIRAAVLTISDSCHAGTRTDKSGPAVRNRILELGWQVDLLEVLPDERLQIAERLRELSSADHALAVFTTGGTGVAHRDITPEATRDVIEKEIPGIGEVMRNEGRKSTRLADLSRGLGGTRGRTLIVNLPGSPKGAIESLNAIVNLVPHILDLLSGNTEHPSKPETVK